MSIVRVTLGAFLVLSLHCSGQVPPSGSNQYELPFKRFEYKYSFKGPYLAQKDGTVPFWEYKGDTIASQDMVRITPSLRSKRGSIWTKVRSSFEWWEVELDFRINGRGRLGADGIGFWFVNNIPQENTNPEVETVFGVYGPWTGLGIFFDSYDNGGKAHNPNLILAMVNDGTKVYDNTNDGINQRLGSCVRDFRNKPFPIKAKIEYYKNTLTVLFNSGTTNVEDAYEICIRVENVFLPQSGHFGVSAATGGLADDHDVLKFLTSSLHPPGSQPKKGGVADLEKEKFAKEYEHYKESFEKQKEDYYKQHPDEERKYREQEGYSPEKEYESIGERNLQQIYAIQSDISAVLRASNHKLDEIIGRQERTLSLISNIQVGGGQVQTGAGGIAMPIQRHEVDSLLNMQQESVRTLRELKTHAAQQQQFQAQPASAQQANMHSLQQQLLTETRDSVNVLRKELGAIASKLAETGGYRANVECPPPANCLSSSHFFVFMSLHLIILIAFSFYKSSRESAAKKFY
ncbi:protein ERGIC-53-like protein [Leptotrombidium deliense]|uniref:Protein ERGIC-53-like protein n=1 Tax=Leptotrombidium deliense TaxID=299467 RepID=A0A443SM42_9ACAR|nr:protein ERGIC-53-like protein [Leptotrombidium deliense]